MVCGCREFTAVSASRLYSSNQAQVITLAFPSSSTFYSRKTSPPRPSQHLPSTPNHPGMLECSLRPRSVHNCLPRSQLSRVSATRLVFHHQPPSTSLFPPSSFPPQSQVLYPLLSPCTAAYCTCKLACGVQRYYYTIDGLCCYQRALAIELEDVCS